MALEIKELEIRMRVSGDEGAPAQRAAAAGGGGECGGEDTSHATLVNDSVRRVLQALKNLEER